MEDPMKSRIPHAIAALLAASAVPLVLAQAKRALDIAAQHAGEGKVANAIQAADV
jgi:hypothetical protein